MIELTDFITQNKIIVICRKIYGEELLSLANALIAGGVKMIEVTYDQVDNHGVEKTVKAIQMLNDRFTGLLRVGAGTVLNIEQVEATKEAGGEYIISPNVNVEVISKTKQLKLVSIPGAMTPTEIMSAHDHGADFVKLFPASYLGFSYIKDIMAPISHVKMIATGGVNEDNFSSFLEAGFVGAGISSRLADKKLIASKNYQEITARAIAFTSIFQSDAK